VSTGLFPGFVYYLTFWYSTEERSIRVAFVLASATLAGAFGGAIAYGVGHMNQTSGLSAWRWLFILEGLPSVISAFFVWFLLPDYPETAGWLSPKEKALVARRLALQASHGSGAAMSWAEAKSTILEWRLWIHYCVCYLCVMFRLSSPHKASNDAFSKIYFGISAPFSSLSLFTPSITAGLGVSNAF